ncbi:hypothetical protein OIO90_000708 [Microbotryomycetes sp. JL221]|nr:hypothetical protein OIO90_000708 [Microbotryomycetes sp. JL221]
MLTTLVLALVATTTRQVALAAPANGEPIDTVLLAKRASLRLADGTSMQSGTVSSTLKWQSSGQLFYDNCPPTVKINNCYQMHLDSVGDLQRRNLDQGGVPVLDLALDPFQIGQFEDAAFDLEDTMEDPLLPSDVFYDDDEVEDNTSAVSHFAKRQTMFCKVTADCAGATVPANGHNWCDSKAGICSFRCNTNYVKADGACRLHSQPMDEVVPEEHGWRCYHLIVFTTNERQFRVCDSGYSLNNWTKQCDKNGVKSSTTTTTKAATTTTQRTTTTKTTTTAKTASTTSSATAPASTNVASTVIPAFANRWCNGTKGVCSWRCMSGYTAVGNTCVKPEEASPVVPSSIAPSGTVISASLTLTATTDVVPPTATSTKTPRQRIEMLSWPPATAGQVFNYQWRSHLASPVSSGYQFFHVMQLLRRVDGGAYVIALSIKNGQVYIDDIARECGLGACPSIPLSSILDRTLQHNATVTWGTLNGAFDYTITDPVTKQTVLSYSATGYMGDQGSLKYGVYRAYVPGMTDLNNYVGDHVAIRLK